MKKESSAYRTETHRAPYGLAVALRKKELSNRAARLLIGLLAEADGDGVFHKPLDYALDWSQQSADTARSALKELISKG